MILQADSRPVTSNQQHIHRRLPTLVRRYLSSESRKPIAEHNRQAFQQLTEQLAQSSQPLVLDSFCGTGQSTAALALRHPDHLVVGIDKSCHRLAKHIPQTHKNYLLLQAECEDIWQLLHQQHISPSYHYLLYPNPWPKSGQLQRRIHGNPGFKSLLGLGGQVELRSNWQLYVEEFGVAMHLAGQPGRVLQVQPGKPISLFEHKYQVSGHTLWSYVGRIKMPGSTP